MTQRGIKLSRNDRIRQLALYAVYILILSTVQVSFPQYLSFRGQTADLMLVFVILVGYFFGPLDGAVVGLITGFLRDVLSGTTLGIGALLLMYAGLFGSLILSGKFHRRAVLGALQVFLITLGYKVIGHMIRFFFPLIMEHDSVYLSFRQVILDSILPQLAVNLVASVPLILLLTYVGPYRRGYIRQDEEQRSGMEELWRTK